MSLTLRRQNKTLSFLLVGILCFTIIAGAALAVPVPVLALSASGIKGTIASIILSLLLQCGVAPVDNQFINRLNGAYGVTSSIGTIEDAVNNGLLINENGTLVDNGLRAAIEAEDAYVDLHIDDIFDTTAVGAGAAVAAAGASTNLLNAAINVGTLGTIGSFAGAAAVGVGLGFLLNNVRENLGKFIKNNFSLADTSAIINSINVNSIIATGVEWSGAEYTWIFNAPNNNLLVGSVEGNRLRAEYINNTYNATVNESWVYKGNTDTNGTMNIGSNGFTSSKTSINCSNTFATSLDYINALNAAKASGSITSNSIASKYTGPYGNQTSNTSGNTVNFPGIKSMVPEGYDMRPVDMDDYINYANTALENYDNNVDQNIQADNFNNFVNDLIQEPVQNPDDIYNPSIPDSTSPTIPDQPDMPTKPDITIGDRDNSLIGTTEGLQNVFPFCIPFDIYNMVTGLTAARSAPSLHVPVGDGQYLDVDLSDYETAASILRALELIAFIVGLAVATRSLIGAKG